jgi:hypothetical protein
MKTTVLLLSGLLFTATSAAFGQTTFVTPDGSGGFEVRNPGSDGGLTTFVTPDGSGGYEVSTPGSDAYEDY